MRQSSYSIGTEQKIIEGIAGGLSWNIPIKITKTAVDASLKEGVLPCGTRIAKDGTVATTTESKSNAYGVLVNDLDFNNSKGTEIAAVNIHGCLSKKLVEKYSGTTVSAEEIAALGMITFI